MIEDVDGRLVAITYVNRIDLDQEWRPAGDRFMEVPELADIAETTYITVHGRSTDLWYRRRPRPFETDRRRIWRSVSGGSAAPSDIVTALTAALDAGMASGP